LAIRIFLNMFPASARSSLLEVLNPGCFAFIAGLPPGRPDEDVWAYVESINPCARGV